MLGFVSGDERVFRELNGIRLKTKKDFVEIDFWMSVVDDENVLEFYREWIIKVTNLENDTPLEVIHFQVE